VLVLAGDLKREYSNLNEKDIVIKSIRNNLFPKVVIDDFNYMENIMMTVFPG